MIRLTPQPWVNEAVCPTVDPELFFPNTSTPLSEIRQIQLVCGGCPVIRECLLDGLQHMSEGIWGGATVNDRKAIRRGTRTIELHIDTLRKKYNDTQKRMAEAR